jgi:hypothetical protein
MKNNKAALTSMHSFPWFLFDEERGYHEKNIVPYQFSPYHFFNKQRPGLVSIPQS